MSLFNWCGWPECHLTRIPHGCCYWAKQIDCPNKRTFDDWKSVETSATLNLTALTTITDEKKPKNASFWHVRSAVDPELFAFIFVKKKQKYFFVTGNHYLAVNCFLSALQTISSFFFQPKMFNIFCAFRGRDRETWTPRIIREPHNYAPRKKQNNAVPTVRSEIGEGNAHWAALVAFVTSVKAFKFGARKTSRDFENSISIQWNIGSQRSLLSKVESSVLISLIKISFRYANEQGCGTGFQRDLLVSKLKKWKLRK